MPAQGFFGLNSIKTSNVSYTLKNINGTSTAGFPVGVIDVQGDFIGRADTKSEVVTIWNNSTVNRSKGTLINSSGFDVTLKLKGGQTAPSQITANERTTIGQFITETFSGSSLARFTQVKPSATFTEASGDLQIVKTTGTSRVDYLKHNNNASGGTGTSMLEESVITSTFTVKTTNSTSIGVGIGLVGGNASSALASIVGYVACDTTNAGKLYIDINYGGTWANAASETVTPMTVSVDDVISLTFTRSKSTFTIVALNTTTAVSKTVSFTYTLSSAAIIMPNFYSYGIFALGGSHNVTDFNVTSSIIKYPKIAFLGDSITQGYVPSNVAGRYASLLNARLNNGWDSVVWAGNYNVAAHLQTMIAELKVIAPDKIIMMIGTNDIAGGLGYAEAGTINLRAAFVTNKMTLLRQLTIPPKTGTVDEDFNTWLQATYTNISVIGSVTMGDPVHPGPTGHTSINNTVATDLPIYFT